MTSNGLNLPSNCHRGLQKKQRNHEVLQENCSPWRDEKLWGSSILTREKEISHVGVCSRLEASGLAKPLPVQWRWR